MCGTYTSRGAKALVGPFDGVNAVCNVGEWRIARAML
jgi:hypothetical protein